MKNFDYNTSYHPHHPHHHHHHQHQQQQQQQQSNNVYSNHSYNHNNLYHPYQQAQHQLQRQRQQEQQPQQQQQQILQQPTFNNYYQLYAASQLQQQNQQQQLQKTQQQQPPQNQQQQLQKNQQEQQLTITPTTAAAIKSSYNSTNNFNSNQLNMQAASTYATIFANYNNNQNNYNANNNNNNSNNHINSGSNNNNVNHVSSQQQQQQQQLQQNITATDKLTMDACEIANFLANELFMQQLVSVDGIQSGVPTLTTSTLTPTTLRSIEETFIQLTSEPINAPYQAGFIPPPLAPFSSVNNTGAVVTPTTNYSSIHDFNDGLDTESEDSKGSWNAAHLDEENSIATTDTSSGATDSTSFQNGLNGMGNNSLATSTSSTNDFTSVNIALAAAAAAAAAGKISSSIPNNKNTSNSATPRRNQGGRRPNKSANMTPEEEEKRRVRRERNKLAAARCRKRRVDQTNELLEEVAILEKRREGLQKDIESLNTTKHELEYLLETHRPTCQKVREDMLSVSTYGGLIGPTSNCSTITGLDATLSTTGRSHSPIDLKPVLLPGSMLEVIQVKNEPLDTALDSGSSLDAHDHDGPPSPKRILLTRNNPMIPPPLPNVATLSASLAAASASLNTPIMTTAPVSFSSFGSFNNNCATLQTLNALNGKQRPNTLPNVPRNLTQNLGLNVDNKPPTDINGVAIQTPSTGMFNFDSLMDGGTGLTPVSGPLIPTCSSQNKHPLELTTPTSEPSKLVSL